MNRDKELIHKLYRGLKPRKISDREAVEQHPMLAVYGYWNTEKLLYRCHKYKVFVLFISCFIKSNSETSLKWVFTDDYTDYDVDYWMMDPDKLSIWSLNALEERKRTLNLQNLLDDVVFEITIDDFPSSIDDLPNIMFV